MSQQLQTSMWISAVYKLKPLICEMGWEEVNLPNDETQKIFDICGEKIIHWVVEVFRHSAEIERVTLSLQDAGMESARIQSLWKTPKILGAVGVFIQKKCVQQVSHLEKLFHAHHWKHIAVPKTFIPHED